MVDYRRQQREYGPIHIERATVERVKSLKFTDDLKTFHHTDTMVKAQQHLHYADPQHRG